MGRQTLDTKGFNGQLPASRNGTGGNTFTALNDGQRAELAALLWIIDTRFIKLGRFGNPMHKAVLLGMLKDLGDVEPGLDTLIQLPGLFEVFLKNRSLDCVRELLKTHREDLVRELLASHQDDVVTAIWPGIVGKLSGELTNFLDARLDELIPQIEALAESSDSVARVEHVEVPTGISQEVLDEVSAQLKLKEDEIVALNARYADQKKFEQSLTDEMALIQLGWVEYETEVGGLNKLRDELLQKIQDCENVRQRLFTMAVSGDTVGLKDIDLPKAPVVVAGFCDGMTWEEVEGLMRSGIAWGAPLQKAVKGYRDERRANGLPQIKKLQGPSFEKLQEMIDYAQNAGHFRKVMAEEKKKRPKG